MRKYSQVFLNNPLVAERIAQTCKKNPFDILVEIGPGKGFLTDFLAARFAGRVIAVEIDPEMVKHLEKKYGGSRSVNIVRADFLQTDISELVPKHAEIHFAGNLPYAAASPILQKLLDWPRFNSAVLMFQKEVAERIIAPCGTSRYGMLSLSAQTRADVSWIMEVSRSNFIPKPKVDSAVLHFQKRKTPFFGGKEEEKRFFKIARLAFMHKRKTVLNSIVKALKCSKPEISGILKFAGIDPALRAETIPPEKYAELAKLSLGIVTTYLSGEKG